MKKNEICRYHNDLSKVQLPNLNELQLNVFYSLIHKMRHKQQGELVVFKPHEIKKMMINPKRKRDFNDKELTKTTKELFEKLFKMDFRQLIQLDDGYREEYRHLFKTMYLNYNDFDILKDLWLEIDEHFEYLVGDFWDKKYIEFDLTEFASISGKYTKEIYLKLKKYRTQGWWLVEWRVFRELLHIPASYQISDIDKRILKPAIKELTAERTLLNQKLIPFKNLKYEKLTRSQQPNTPPLTPHFIKFTFTKQDTTKSFNYKFKCKLFSYNGKIWRIEHIEKVNGKLVVSCLEFNPKTQNLVSKDKLKTMNFKNIEHAEQFILENEYKI